MPESFHHLSRKVRLRSLPNTSLDDPLRMYELAMLRDQPGVFGHPFLSSCVLQLRRLDAAVEMLDSPAQSAWRSCTTCRLVRPEANE